MGLLVQKFGGTSVATPERIHAVAQKISDAQAAGHSLVVVVSAMGDTTDELIALAHQVSKNPPHREMDMLLTAGERISMALLSMALAEKGIHARSFTGSQSGIITTPSHRRARIKRILGDRLRAALAEGSVVIVAGFQGVSETKEVTTLGRGGSDTTAVALAATLGAESCEIYTDVDGIYSADPRVVPEAHFWKTIPCDLMIELAVRGAGVLHPRSVELAREHQVKLFVKNSLSTQNQEGTQVITSTPHGSVADASPAAGNSLASSQQSPPKGMEEFRVAGVTADASKVLVRVQLMRSTVMGAVWGVAASAQLSVVSPHFSQHTLEFFAAREAEEDWKKHLNQLILDGFVKSFEFEQEWVPVSIVGSRFSQDPTALCEIFETLAQSAISVTMGAASALAIHVAVPRNRADEAVQVLHQKFMAESV